MPAPTLPDAPLLWCSGGPWHGRRIVRTGRTLAFSVWHHPETSHRYHYDTTTPGAPVWMYKGTRRPTAEDGLFEVRYHYREG